MYPQVILTCRSLTYAQRTARALSNAGMTAHIIKSPQNITSRGCGYAVRIPEARLSAALELLRSAMLVPDGAFIQSGGGYVEVGL